MRKVNTDPDFVIFCCLLSVYASESMLTCGAQLNGLVIKHGLDLHASVSNTLLAMYSRLECFPDVK
jgi:hypothetical protein